MRPIKAVKQKRNDRNCITKFERVRRPPDRMANAEPQR
jgi:hypothetical protein